MAINPIPVDQRVIDIDSRRFASIDKALVELITNSDDSYSRLERARKRGRRSRESRGAITVLYERHKAGAFLAIADQAEGMTFDVACRVLAYGAAHSPLSRGEGGGRGYFGRGLKQAVYGLGHGWVETIRDGRYTRIEMFRADNGGYLYDDGGGDRAATELDYEHLGLHGKGNGTRVAIVVDSPRVTIPLFGSLAQTVTSNIYLRDVLLRRDVTLVRLENGKEVDRSGPLRHEEPPAAVLIGPEFEGHFEHDGRSYPYYLTLKRALGAELTPRGDERTNGLLVVSDTAVLDCQLFDFENQVGTEYLFGTVQCPALIDKLGDGHAIVSDEREGLNLRDAFVGQFARAVSRQIAPWVAAEQEKLKHLDHATTSGRTTHMIEHILERMNLAAIHDLGVSASGSADSHEPADQPAHTDPLRFSTPFYYRQPGHRFHVTLLLDPDAIGQDELLRIESTLPESISIDPVPASMRISDLEDPARLAWSLESDTAGDRGEITVQAGNFLAWCEIVIADHAPRHHHHSRHHRHTPHRRLSRDHGEILFAGYELRNLGNEPERAVYSPEERKILINTGAPTVQLYVDGRGHFRDSARLLLAELFMDAIAEELAKRITRQPGQDAGASTRHAVKLDIIRRYGTEIHRSFGNA